MIYYTKEKLQEAINKSECISDVIRILKRTSVIHGASHSYIKKKILEFKLDTTHFISKSKALARGGGLNKRTASELLVKDRKFIAHAAQIKRALLEIGRNYICEICNNSGQWQGQKITLEIDHIDGNKSNDLPENLRFLCPNCHSQTSNFRSKNRRGKSIADENRLESGRALKALGVELPLPPLAG